ncbi:MAG: Ig-like domain-containing protein [Peptococcaceae bacterium]|jgi:hypothetical protein|nr:Ig-like domain-containing protein [Peptococcaceae bacterium]
MRQLYLKPFAIILSKPLTIVLIMLLATSFFPTVAAASTPSTYLSDIDRIKGSAQAVWQITPESEGLEFLVVLVSEDDLPLSGSIYAASSRAYPTDAFFFEDAGGAWIAAGADGEIPLSVAATDSKTEVQGTLERVLSFKLKVVSVAPGKPIFALGLHADCTAAYVLEQDFPTGCDLTHIIRQSAFGGSAEEKPPMATEESLIFPYGDRLDPWMADGVTSYPLRARVSENGKAISGKEVFFSIIEGEGASLSAASAVSDQFGVAEVKISAAVAGSYVVEVSLGGNETTQKELTVAFIRYQPKLVFAVGSPHYTVDGNLRNALAPSFIESDRVFLSIRDMGTALQAIIDWDPDTQSATLRTNEATVRVTVGADVIYANQSGNPSEISIDAPAINRDGRVYLPFRAVLEAFGYQVAYDGSTGEITCQGLL